MRRIPTPWRRAAFAGLLVAVLVVLLAPPVVEDGTGPDDKTSHVVTFAVLTLAGLWARLGWRRVVPLLVAYAALTEVLQGTLTTDRFGDPADWVADLIGIALGLGAAQVLVAGLGSSEDPADRATARSVD